MPWKRTLKFFFTVFGEPKGKQRPRDNGHFYTPMATRQYEAEIRQAFRKANEAENVPPIKGHVGIVIDAYCRIPKSYKDPETGKKKKVTPQMFDDMFYNRKRPIKTPDWDNIGKIVCDALNGLAYDDDKQIIDPIGPRKWFSTSPRVEVQIYDETWVDKS